MKHTTLALAMFTSLGCNMALAQTDSERIEQLQQQLEALTQKVDELSQASTPSNLHIGGYGELHYNSLEQSDGTDEVELDLHRFVIFFGYDFNDRMRFVSEFEVEHVLAGDNLPGEVEIEQAFLEFDLASNMQLKTGVILMPIGIVNETHEPPTFYGVERPVVEQTIIPSTWWSGGIMFSQQLENGFSYDLMLHEGLETPSSDPFNIKAGKQKTAEAHAQNLALTGRAKFTGISGLELAAYAQYQSDLDQSAETSYAEAATFFGGHASYQFSGIKITGLYARWDIEGDDAETAGKAVQDGMYAEASYKLNDNTGLFVRHSQWSVEDNVDNQQLDAGVNYWPHENIVFKFNLQSQNDEAKNSTVSYTGDGFSLGMGYQF